MYSMIKQHMVPVLFFVFLTLIFTFPVCFKMNSILYGPLYGTDSRGTIWQLWWGKYSYEQGLRYAFHSTIAAPFGNDVSDFPQGFLWSLIIRWLPIATNEVFAYNFVLLVSFFLSSFFVYMIAYSLTKNRAAAFVSGFIFGFCPYHFQRSWEHFSLAQIQWPALYFFALLKLYKSLHWKNIVFFVVAATLVLHLEFNYAYVVFVLTALFLCSVFLLNVFDNLVSRAKNVATFKGVLRRDCRFLLFLFISGFFLFLLNANFLLSIMKATSHASTGFVGLVDRPFHYLFSQSARPLSYFIPSSANPILGSVAKALEGSIFYGRGPIEQTLYLGWIPILLGWLAWKQRLHFVSDKQNGFDGHFYIRLFLIISAGAFIFSLPPYYSFGFFKIYFPSFFMYKLLPMFRAYARFGLMVILLISILAGMGVSFLLAIKKIRHQKIMMSIIVILLLFEFNNIPPLRFVDSNAAPQVYQWLAQQKGAFIIAEYPLGEAATGETYVELDYLYYQRIHRKRLVNGIVPGTVAYSINEKMTKIDDERTPAILNSLGVKYVIMHLARYRQGTDKKAVDVIGEVPDLRQNPHFRLVKQFQDDEVYEVMKNN